MLCVFWPWQVPGSLQRWLKLCLKPVLSTPSSRLSQKGSEQLLTVVLSDELHDQVPIQLLLCPVAFNVSPGT